MDIVIRFFTETPSIIEVFYIIFFVSLVTYSLLKILPEEKGIKYLTFYRLYDWDKYDVVETVRRQRKFAFRILVFSTGVIGLYYIAGEVVLGVGILLIIIFVLALSIFSKVDPVKKNEL